MIATTERFVGDGGGFFGVFSDAAAVVQKVQRPVAAKHATALSLSEKRSQNIFNTCGYSSAMHPNELPLFAMRIVLLLARKTRPSNAHAFNLLRDFFRSGFFVQFCHKVLKTAASTDANASKIAACFSRD